MLDAEPVGIVIADGGAAARPTRFSAFVWGPVPEDAGAEVMHAAADAESHLALAAGA